MAEETSYQSVGTPRFYVNVLEWLDSNDYIPMNAIYGFTLYTTFRTLPVKQQYYSYTLNLEYYIPHMLKTKSFVAVLAHRIANKYGSYELENWSGNIDYFNANSSIIEHDGFSISLFNGDSLVDENGQQRIHFRETNMDDPGVDIGSIVIGSYYDIPKAPNLSLTMSIEYGGIKETTTRNGGYISNRIGDKPPHWGRTSFHHMGPWELSQPAGYHPHPSIIARSGRRSWDLEFSYIDDGDLFGPNQSLSNWSSESQLYHPIITPMGYDGGDLANPRQNRDPNAWLKSSYNPISIHTSALKGFAQGIIIDAGNYYGYVQVTDSGDSGISDRAIKRYKSSDGRTNWVADGNEANGFNLRSGTAGEFDDSRVNMPYVWIEEDADAGYVGAGKWKMIYGGWKQQATNAGNCNVGLATSPDGVNWTKYSGNPVMEVGEDGQWDAGDAEPWGITKVRAGTYGTFTLASDTYFMYYSQIARAWGTPVERWSGIATSTDLINWYKHDNNPYFENVYSADVFKFQDYWYMLAPKYSPGEPGPYGDGIGMDLFRSNNPYFEPYDNLGMVIPWGGEGGDGGAWEDDDVDAPMVVVDNIYKDVDPAGFRVYYGGDGKNPSTGIFTGYSFVADVYAALGADPDDDVTPEDEFTGSDGFNYNILTDDSFFSQVWHKTNGGQLPFIFQPDNENKNTDQFAICRFKENSLKVTQAAPNVYNISLKIEEVW